MVLWLSELFLCVRGRFGWRISAVPSLSRWALADQSVRRRRRCSLTSRLVGLMKLHCFRLQDLLLLIGSICCFTSCPGWTSRSLHLLLPPPSCASPVFHCVHQPDSLTNQLPALPHTCVRSSVWKPSYFLFESVPSGCFSLLLDGSINNKRW